MNEAGQILDKAIVEPVQVNPTAPDAPKEPPAPIKDDRVSSKLSVLIRREQEAVRLEKLARQKQSEVEAQLKEIEEFKSLRSDPVKAITKLGYSPEDFAKIQTGDGQIPADIQIKELKRELDALRNDRALDKDQAKVAAERQAQEENEKIITSFKGEISSFLTENEARYEFIKFNGESGEDLVYSIIDEHYRRTVDPTTGVGEILSKKDAADKVEQHFEDQYNRSRTLSKAKALWGNVPKDAQEKIAKQVLPKTSQPPKTLTNQLSATPTTTAPRKTLITDDERVAKAIAYAQSLRA